MTQTQTGRERRQYHRFPFSGTVHIRGGGSHWSGPLVDVSLKGILMVRPGHWEAHHDQPYQLELALTDGALTLNMEGAVAHTEGGHIGFRFTHIDIECISHLRRLVELNLGDETLLQRELEALISDGSHTD